MSRVTPHRYRGRNWEGTLPLREDILDMRNDSFFPVHIPQKMKMVKTLAYNVWKFVLEPKSCTSDTRLHWPLIILE